MTKKKSEKSLILSFTWHVSIFITTSESSNPVCFFLAIIIISVFLKFSFLTSCLCYNSYQVTLLRMEEDDDDDNDDEWWWWWWWNTSNWRLVLRSYFFKLSSTAIKYEQFPLQTRITITISTTSHLTYHVLVSIDSVDDDVDDAEWWCLRSC